MAKYALNGLRMHLLQSRISKNFRGRTPIPPAYQRVPPSLALPHLRLRCSVRASGTQLSSYFIN
jgi:hypothetical protein